MSLIARIKQAILANPDKPAKEAAYDLDCCGRDYHRAVRELKREGLLPDDAQNVRRARELEKKIIHLKKKGWANPQIADYLDISTSKVRRVKL